MASTGMAVAVLSALFALAPAALHLPLPPSPTTRWQLVAGNNIAHSGVGPGSSHPPVYYHGDATSSGECQDRCSTNSSCRSFAWASGPSTVQQHGADLHHSSAPGSVSVLLAACPYTGQCFFRVDTIWDPVEKPGQACSWEAGRKLQPTPTRNKSTALKNVLYVMVDDLRAQLGCYGHNSTVHTPNVDRLAGTGTLFQHAYVQIAVCSPSRTSFLTGLRPQQSNVLNFATDFRRATPGGAAIVTLPAFFKGKGVLATGLGKTFHPGLPANYDEPASWSPDFPYITAPAGSSKCAHGTSPWCSQGASVPANDYADGVIVTDALHQLGVIAATYHTAGPAPQGANPLSRAFFMAVGLHRPHMDWVVPPSFLALQPPAKDIKLADHPTFPGGGVNGTPAWAFYNCTELTARPRLDGHAIETEVPFPAVLGQTIRRNYYAAVEYMDSQVGRLLDGLDELGLTGSTAVVFHGDHGWKLGELGQWCKETVFENDARTPLLVRAPWITASAGRRVGQVVELIDIFVTLADLAGLGTATLPSMLEGRSLVPLLRGAPPNASAAAFSTYPRWKLYDNHTHCFRPCREIEAIALSVRTASWRFTDWVAWDAAHARPAMSTVLASELYDHGLDDGMGADAFDAFEVVNLAHSAAHVQTVAALRVLLHRNFGGWPARGNTSFTL